MKTITVNCTSAKLVPSNAMIEIRLNIKYLGTRAVSMGVDHGGGGREGQVPPRIWSGGIVPPPQILSCGKILSTRLLALQCRKMCFLSLQQDFFSKTRHASPQNSSQIYAYGCVSRINIQLKFTRFS